MIEFENRDVVNEFLEETLSGFDTVEAGMLDLEKEPENVDIINVIFRPIHSLKGNSAYFGLMKVKKLTHSMENLLDFARKGKIKINSEIINLLLSGVDYLREMITRVNNDEDEVLDKNKYENYLEQFDKIVVDQNRPYTISEKEKEKLIEFLESAREGSTKENQLKIHELLSIFKKEAEVENVNAAKFDEILALKEILKQPLQDFEANDTEIENIKSKIKAVEKYGKDGNPKNLYKELMETFEAFAYSGIGIDELGLEILNDKVKELEAALHTTGTDKSVEEVKEVEDGQKENQQLQKKDTPAAPKSNKAQTENATIRINEQSLDEFLGYVAELLNIEELFNFTSRDLARYDSNLSSNFKRNLDDFSRISTNLRNGIMEIRKVKASNLLQKTQRIVRDIALKSGKKIKINIIGEELKIDKNYLELLDAPLVHMVRNAADHGIETAEVRVSNGKEEEGKIFIHLYEDEKNLLLEITDDGKGLDLERLKLKAIEKGLISSNQKLEERDIIDLLFQSGVSTAEEITDVSGRGVGMDVVKTAIESANGKIGVETQKDKGSKFSITLPRSVSTQINDVYLVKSFSEGIYALPLKMIEEAFTIDYRQIFSVQNQGNVIKRRGKLLSVFFLDNILEAENRILDNSFSDRENIPFLYYNIPGNPLAICVKDVIGVQTIVIKNIENIGVNCKIFDGAATLGDGKIALKISPQWLNDYAKSHI